MKSKILKSHAEWLSRQHCDEVEMETRRSVKMFICARSKLQSDASQAFLAGRRDLKYAMRGEQL